MADKILFQQLAFSIDKAGAVASSKTNENQNRLYGHLTKGWDGSIWKEDAITWRANVPTTLTADERDTWDFGFVQIAEATKFQAFYSARIPSEGAIILDYFLKPAMTQTILLDGGEKGVADPWYRLPQPSFVNNRMQGASGDHPGLAVPLRIENRVCNYVKNYLFHVIMDRRFWTVFTAKPPGGDLQYIGHFAWRLRYEFMLKWQNQAAIVPVNRSVLEVPDKGVPGRPTEGAIQAMLSSPAGPRANAIGTRAQAATEAGSDPNRRDLNQRFRNTPPDFWTQT